MSSITGGQVPLHTSQGEKEQLYMNLTKSEGVAVTSCWKYGGR